MPLLPPLTKMNANDVKFKNAFLCRQYNQAIGRENTYGLNNNNNDNDNDNDSLSLPKDKSTYKRSLIETGKETKQRL